MSERIEKVLAGMSNRQSVLATKQGEQCEVALLGLDSPTEVLKIPKLGTQDVFGTPSALVEYEASVVACLQGSRRTAPVEIPEVIASDHTTEIPYNVFTFVPGESLTNPQIRELSEKDQQSIGRTFGRFVVWLDNAMRGTYDERLASVPKIHFTRADAMERRLHPQEVSRFKQAGCEWFTELIAWHHSVFPEQEAAALIEAPIVGHDDIRSENIGFEHTEAKLISIFDFAQTRRTSVAVEMRHFACMGNAVLDAALREYTALTGTAVDKEGVMFMARTQALTENALNVRDSNPERRRAAFDELKLVFGEDFRGAM